MPFARLRSLGFASPPLAIGLIECKFLSRAQVVTITLPPAIECNRYANVT